MMPHGQFEQTQTTNSTVGGNKNQSFEGYPVPKEQESFKQLEQMETVNTSMAINTIKPGEDCYLSCSEKPTCDNSIDENNTDSSVFIINPENDEQMPSLSLISMPKNNQHTFEKNTSFNTDSSVIIINSVNSDIDEPMPFISLYAPENGVKKNGVTDSSKLIVNSDDNHQRPVLPLNLNDNMETFTCEIPSADEQQIDMTFLKGDLPSFNDFVAQHFNNKVGDFEDIKPNCQKRDGSKDDSVIVLSDRPSSALSSSVGDATCETNSSGLITIQYQCCSKPPETMSKDDVSILTTKNDYNRGSMKKCVKCTAVKTPGHCSFVQIGKIENSQMCIIC